jgi:hypothetical protein
MNLRNSHLRVLCEVATKASAVAHLCYGETGEGTKRRKFKRRFRWFKWFLINHELTRIDTNFHELYLPQSSPSGTEVLLQLNSSSNRLNSNSQPAWQTSLPAGFQIRIFADRIVKVEAINLPRSYVLKQKCQQPCWNKKLKFVSHSITKGTRTYLTLGI